MQIRLIRRSKKPRQFFFFQLKITWDGTKKTVMSFAPASALHSWRSSVCLVRRPPHSHPGAILTFCAPPARPAGSLSNYFWPPLALRPNTKAVRRSGGAFATPVFISGKSCKETAWLPAPPPRLAWRRNGAARLVRSSLRSSLPRLRPPGTTRTKTGAT